MTPDQLERLPRILFEIGKAVGSHNDLGAMLTTISERVTELVSAEACSIMLVDETRTKLMGRAAHGLERDDISVVSFEIGKGVAGWVAAHSVTACIGDVSKDERYVSLPDSQSRIRSMACVPLLDSEELVGVLTVTSPNVENFKDSDVELLMFVAKTIALDMENLRLRRVSVTDALTGAFNREHLNREMPRAIALAKRTGKNLSVAMIDVDHFKTINDCHGHDVGDEVLAEIALKLREATRAGDMLVRYGGEEFLLVLPGSDETDAREISDRMRQKIATSTILAGDSVLDIRVSIGVAQLSECETGAQLTKRADKALYLAKSKGRNRVEVSSAAEERRQ